MKITSKIKYRISGSILLFFSFLFTNPIIAQDAAATTDSTVAPEVPEKPVDKPVKRTFESNWILDNQTVMVNKKGSFEMNIQHRFGTWKNGYSDLYGIYAPANIRISFYYVAANKLQLGFGFTKEKLQWDGNLKYAITKQTVSGKMPVSITFFGNAVVDTRAKTNFVKASDRYSYFSQLMIARKINDKISVQVSPSLSYMNNVPAYVDSKGDIVPLMKNAHFAMAFMGKFRITQKSSILINYDQPLTQHLSNNPHPNISLGYETITSSHSFQVFAGNYYSILPQDNNMLNQNDYMQGQFLIGFNITRNWNF